MIHRHCLAGGGGGHFTWGTPGEDLLPAPAALDENDPNYDPEEDAAVGE